jgi:hypothetical protein
MALLSCASKIAMISFSTNEEIIWHCGINNSILIESRQRNI